MLKILFRLSIVAVIVLLAYFANFIYKKATSTSLNVVDDKMYVETISVKTMPMPLSYKTVASLTAKYDISLASAFDGQLVKIIAKSGTKVKKGQPLITLLPKANVIAPIDGIVGKWHVKPGEYIKKGTLLTRIVDKNKLQAEYYVPEKYAKLLETGQKVIVSVRDIEEDDKDREINARVKFVSPFVDPMRHSILVQIALENYDKKLLPGLFCRVNHILKTNPKALVISESCLIQTLTGYEVFVVKKNKVVKTVVTIGARNDGRVEILSGLAENDQVVLTIAQGLMDGKNVVPEKFTGAW